MPIVEIKKTSDIFYEIMSFDANFSAHLHKNLELSYLLEGKFTTTIDGKVYNMEAGDICVSFPYCVHEGNRNGQNKAFLMIYDIDAEPYADILKSSVPEYAMINERDLPAEFRNNIFTLTNGYSTPTTIFESQIRDSLISLILAQCIEKLNIISRCLQKSDDNLMIKTLVYCTDNYTNPKISLESAASAMFVSKYYLSRLFSSKMNIGFKKYITKMRIEKATRFLTSTDIKINEISALCGFANVRTFNREFFLVIGITPRDYRKTNAVSTFDNDMPKYFL